MTFISRLNNYLKDRRLLKTVRKLSKITMSNKEMREIPVTRSMFLLPGKYSLVYYDKYNNTTIQKFIVKEPSEVTIQEIFSLK